jgi:hypothetical protein
LDIAKFSSGQFDLALMLDSSLSPLEVVLRAQALVYRTKKRRQKATHQLLAVGNKK